MFQCTWNAPEAWLGDTLKRMSVPQAPKGLRLFRSVVAEEAWLNDMAAQGQSVTGVKRGRFTFAPVEPGSVRVYVEPSYRTVGRHLVAYPISAIMLAKDPATRVVSTDSGRLIAVRRTVDPSGAAVPDPLDRLHPLARAAGYRQAARQSRIAGAVCLGIFLLMAAWIGWLLIGEMLPSLKRLTSTGYTIDRPLTVVFIICALIFLAVLGSLVWMGLVVMAPGFAAADRLRSPVAPPPDGSSVVRLVGMSAETRHHWLTEQAERGWALVSWDGWSEYVFEPTQPGQYTIAAEAIGLGFIPTYVFGSSAEPELLAPGDALTTRQDAQIVGASPEWVVARRPAEHGPLTPPWPLPQLAANYTSSADRMRKAIPRTAGVVVMDAVFVALCVLLFITLGGFDGISAVMSGPLVIVVVIAAQLVFYIWQLVNLIRRRRALRAWAERYSQQVGNPVAPSPIPSRQT